jgi:preprotein translocase subunit Sec63
VVFYHYYRMLGIPAGASQKEITQAYRKLARQFHPDLHPPERKGWAEEQMKRLNEAYAVLNDPQARAHYDIALWGHLAALSRIRRGGPGRRRFAMRVKSAIWALAVGFLVLGVLFYLFDWNVLFQGAFTAGQMLGLRWAFAQAWVAVLGILFLRFRR